MTVKKEGVLQRFIGASTDTKPTNVGFGSTFLEYDTSEIHITYDGTTWVKKNIAPFNAIKTIRTVKTLAAASIYDVADVLSEAAASSTVWRFNSVVDGNGGAGIITNAQCMTETATASGDVSLYLFITTPSCELDDHSVNTAPLYNDVTASKYIGRIGFPKLAAAGSTGEAIAQATPYTASSGLPLPFVCGSASNALFGVAVCETALGIAPSSDMMFVLTIEKR